MTRRLPVFILGGSDLRPGAVPPGLSREQMLTGYKGLLPLPGGCPLAGELITRLRSSGRFLEPRLVGPREVYEGCVDCEILDARGSLATTLATLAAVLAAEAEQGPVAVCTCDVLPTSEELREIIDGEFEPYSECRFWWQFIVAVPEELGPSGWKPHYTIRPTPDAAPLIVYPGHLVIFRPPAVRLELLIHLLSLAYRHRNLPLRRRVLPMLVRGLGELVRQDFRNLRRGQFPLLSFSIPWHLWSAYRQMQRGTLTVAGLEAHAAKVLLHRESRSGPRPVVISLSRVLSLAQDIDSRAELEAAIARGGFSTTYGSSATSST